MIDIVLSAVGVVLVPISTLLAALAMAKLETHLFGTVVLPDIEERRQRIIDRQRPRAARSDSTTARSS